MLHNLLQASLDQAKHAVFTVGQQIMAING